MTKIDDETRLRHMLDAAREASLFIQGKTRSRSIRNECWHCRWLGY